MIFSVMQLTLDSMFDGPGKSSGRDFGFAVTLSTIWSSFRLLHSKIDDEISFECHFFGEGGGGKEPEKHESYGIPIG